MDMKRILSEKLFKLTCRSRVCENYSPLPGFFAAGEQKCATAIHALKERAMSRNERITASRGLM